MTPSRFWASVKGSIMPCDLAMSRIQWSGMTDIGELLGGMAKSHGMIEPFTEAQKREGVISYGVSSYGYDARVSLEFKIFTNVDSAIVDPKDFSAQSFVDRETDVCVIPPN